MWLLNILNVSVDILFIYLFIYLFMTSIALGQLFVLYIRTDSFEMRGSHSEIFNSPVFPV